MDDSTTFNWQIILQKIPSCHRVRAFEHHRHVLPKLQVRRRRFIRSRLQQSIQSASSTRAASGVAVRLFLLVHESAVARTSGAGNFAEQVDEYHFLNRISLSTSNTRIGDDHCQALRAGDGDVDPVPVEYEFKATRAVLAVTGTEGQDADRGFLALELIHTADPCSIR